MDEEYFKKLAQEADIDQNSAVLTNTAKIIGTQVAVYYKALVDNLTDTNLNALGDDAIAQLVIDFSWLTCLAFFFKDRELPSRP